MTERPILMSAPMVRAILDGSKTQTRRVVKKVLPVGATDPKGFWGPLDCECIMDRDHMPSALEMIRQDCSTHYIGGKLVGTDLCPYGEPEDRLWVKENYTFGELFKADGSQYGLDCIYAADGKISILYECDAPIDTDFTKLPTWKLRPSIFMYRWASRITLEIASIRLERLQEISEDDAKAEGVRFDGGYWLGGVHAVKGTPQCWATAKRAYEALWNSINGPRAWDLNPWVWAVTFKRVEQGGGA